MILDKAPYNADAAIMVKKQSVTFSNQLREAVRNSESTCYAISKETGIDQAVLSKFLRGERGMLIPSIDALVEYLNLELSEKKRKG